MKRFLCVFAACMAGIVITAAGVSLGGETPRFGIRGGVGTDINLGLAYGAGGNILLNPAGTSLEIGVLVFGGSFKETTDEGINTYKETTDILVFGVLGNYLLGYTPNKAGIFGVLGFGLGVINVQWEERSDTDVSLGPLLPGGGSMQSADGSTAGTVFNLGIGGSFKSGLDLRAEIPVIVPFSPPGKSAGVVPTAIGTIGYRF
jgi:hypothetical protein